MNNTARCTLILVLILTTLLPVQARSSTGRKIILQESHQLVIEAKGTRRIAVGNPDVIRASVLDHGNSLLIVGLQRGTTDIILWKKNEVEKIIVEVTKSEKKFPARDRSELMALLEAIGVANPVIRTIDGKIVIYGVADEIVQSMVEKLSAGFKDAIWAIKAPKEEKREIMYRLRFIEIEKGELKNFGVSWPPSEAFSVSFRKSDRATVYASAGLDLFLKNLISTGKARLLAEPLLVCEEDSTASFHAGGQIPIVIINGETKKVVWKNYGLLLKISPKKRSEKEVSTSIEAEISTLNHSTGTGGIPGILTRKVNTTFTVPFGKTIVLSGLIRSETVKDVSKLPLLGSIPIIGELFKSRNFRNNRSELMVTITPAILTDYENNRMEKKMRDGYTSMGDELRLKLLD